MWQFVLCIVLLSAPAVAQSRVGSVRASPFVPGESRIYDAQGNLVGTARENPFIPGRTDLYDATGRSTGVEVQQNPFDPSRKDVFDTGEHKGE